MAYYLAKKDFLLERMLKVQEKIVVIHVFLILINVLNVKIKTNVQSVNMIISELLMENVLAK